jgi:hypothetical protein
MDQDLGTPIPPIEDVPPEPKKRNSPLIIVLVVVLIVLCCCCLIIAAGLGAWFYGDQIFFPTPSSLFFLLSLV